MKPATRRRRIANAIALAVGVTSVFAAAAVVSRAVFEAPRERVSPLPGLRLPAPAQPVQPQLFQITALEGEVEAQHDGAWSLLQAGDYLSRDDVVRTPVGGRATLRRGAIEIEIRERSQVKLDKLADATARLAVLEGAGDVSAAVTADNETLEIASNDTATVNRGQARWVVSGREGHVYVATKTGEVSFSAHGREVLVRAGHESHAANGEPPSEPEGIPEDVLLSVFWPQRAHTGDDAPVRGKTRPSSRVRVNGRPVPVERDGSFQAPVRLEDGDNSVQVEAEDIVGRRRTLSNVLRGNGRAPVLEPKKEDLWKQR
jgi:hypothetical protein